VVQSADVRDVVAAELVPPDPRDQHRPLLQRVRALHVLGRRLLYRDGARRGAQLGEARRGHEQGEEQSRRRPGHADDLLVAAGRLAT
jgi:hypothetical protein